MYTPHSVTLYNVCRDEAVFVTFLEGVFLDIHRGGKVSKNGAVSNDNATLFVPFSCEAVDPISRQKQQFCIPKTFDRLESKGGFWTAGPGSERSCADCFFVKGRVVVPDMPFAEINDTFDAVFRVSSVDVRDFGSPELRHWMIGGR